MRLVRPLRFAVVLAAAAGLLAGCSGNHSTGTPVTPRTSRVIVPASHPPTTAASAGPVATVSPTPTPTATVSLPAAARPLPGADGVGVVPLAPSVAAALGGPLTVAALGAKARVHALVVDAATGQVVLDQGAEVATAPASTVKIATAAAALTALGSTGRITTEVLGPAPVGGVVTGDLVFRGGGDPTVTNGALSVATGQLGLKPLADRVTVAGLAAAVKAAGVRSIAGRVLGDSALFQGPSTASGWNPTYVSGGSVAPVTALEVDGGRFAPSLEPAPRVSSPALSAAVDLEAALRADGIAITGEAAQLSGEPAAGLTVLAQAQGPTVAELVRQMLTYSDDDLAECLGRLVAIHQQGVASFAGAAAAVQSVDAGAGLSLGPSTLQDTSGLSTFDRVRPAALVAILRAAVGGGRPELRPLALGLPVAARTGTLAARYRTVPAAAAAGRVHAKTGALTGISTEDGWVLDASGRLLVFAFGTDAAPVRPAAEAALDVAAAAVASL